MKKNILLTITLLTFISTHYVFANKSDLYFSLGYGGDILQRKGAFSSDNFNLNSPTYIPEWSFSAGYYFLTKEHTKMSLGGSYQGNFRVLMEIENRKKAALGMGMDNYFDAYYKFSFNKYSYAPMNIIVSTGLGLRNIGTPVVFYQESTGGMGVFPDDAKKGTLLGYHLGIKSSISFFYIGMDYTFFPNSFINNSQTAHSLTLSGGVIISSEDLRAFKKKWENFILYS